jgi:hypothetical protein
MRLSLGHNHFMIMGASAIRRALTIRSVPTCNDSVSPRSAAEPLSLKDIRRIADNVAAAHAPPLDVIAIRHAQEGSSYTEVLLALRESRIEPCRILVGISAYLSEIRLPARCRVEATAPRRPPTLTASSPDGARPYPLRLG